MKKILSLALAASLCLTLLAGCSGGGTKPTLKVYNWGDYIGEGVIELFEERYDVNVIYEMFEQNEDMYTKIKNTGSSYDVVIPSDYMISKMIREDMLATLNFDNIPNFALIDDTHKNPEFDPQNQYSVPYMWGTVGIIYNKTMVNGPITSWDDLWDPQYSQMIFMNDSVRDSMGVALWSLGYSCNTGNMDEIRQAEQKLVEQKPLVLAYVGDEVKDKMIQGEGALAVVYSGDAMTMMDEEEGNPDLDFVVPLPRSNVWLDSMVVLKTSQNKELAEKFINFMCETEVAELNRDYINYATPQREVYEALPDELKSDIRAYADQATIDRCETYLDLGDMQRVYEEFWVTIKAE